MYQDLQPNIEFVNQYDPEIAALMGKELARQQRNIELIASENIASPRRHGRHGHSPDQQIRRGLPRQALLRRLRVR